MADVDAAGRLVPSSIRLYWEGAAEDMVPASLGDIPTEAEAELLGYRSMEEICRDVGR